ncbi:hypothetical protein LPJ56_002693 [Coemansia sp. RSA 2599]|nr:hypothetical protein LPJ56_002693 [Coemansia sp. RSA 2599]
MQGTPRYIYTVILAYELIPGIFVFYNLITSVRVIMHLYVKQRKVSRALNEASHETRQLLTGPSDNAGSGFNSNTRRGSLSSKEVNQLKAVRKDITAKLNRSKTRGFQDTGSQEAIYKPKSRKDGVTITEHTDFGTVHGDSSSIETDGLKNYRIESGVIHHSPSMLEDGGSFTTAYASLEDDDVIRRARAGEDVTGFYDNM